MVFSKRCRNSFLLSASKQKYKLSSLTCIRIGIHPAKINKKQEEEEKKKKQEVRGDRNIYTNHGSRIIKLNDYLRFRDCRDRCSV